MCVSSDNSFPTVRREPTLGGPEGRRFPLSATRPSRLESGFRGPGHLAARERRVLSPRWNCFLDFLFVAFCYYNRT